MALRGGHSLHVLLWLGVRRSHTLGPIRKATKTGDGPPVFTTAFPATRRARSVLTLPASPFIRARSAEEVDLTGSLHDVTLQEDMYYVPTAITNPLFDSFTIDSKRSKTTISVFQITISSRHGGSSQGYIVIDKIIDHLRKLLKKKKKYNRPTVGLTYFLICPKGGPGKRAPKGRMPDGWKKSTDPHGRTFCIEVPGWW